MKLPNVEPNDLQLVSIVCIYTETPYPSCKLKYAPLNVNRKTFIKKIPSLLKGSHPHFLKTWILML